MISRFSRHDGNAEVNVEMVLFNLLYNGLELERLAGEYESRGFPKIMALGVPNAKSYAQPVTHLAIIKTNADRNAPCKGIDFCHNRDKHLQFPAEIQDLTKVVKDLEKMQRLIKGEFDVSIAA